METGWEQLASQLGVATVLAIFFYLILKAYLQRTSELLEDKRLAEKQLVEKTDACAKLTQEFVTLTETFTVTISNHLQHEEEALSEQSRCLTELTKAVEKLCEQNT